VDVKEYLKPSSEEEIELEIHKSKFRRKQCVINECEKKAIISKQNFVGTAEFMAPEIITNNEIGIYTDLWSFGCILFELFMGTSPFRDKTEYLTFQNILNLNYTIDTKIVPEAAKDLIESLLKLDPRERLGSGLSEDNSFEKLKNHNFFKNFDPKKYLGLIEENLRETEPNQKHSRNYSKSALKETSQSEKTLKEEKEKIVKIGELKKKSPWLFYDKRKIILYNTARLDYFDPKTNILKGSISLDKDCVAELTTKASFNLVTPNRTFYFLCKSKYDITPWVSSINEVIKNHCIE
jgi:3-phosphoinositide dependent protein kinase-1